jgi:pyruvate/2-oxoglutarate dehydrogenase complex dihydrolipoamide dehydrogenase (E3) component
LAQAYRRFGSRVSVIESGRQLMSREDADVAAEMHRILSGEGIQILVGAETLDMHGRSGEEVSLRVRASSGEQQIAGSDILVAAGRIPVQLLRQGGDPGSLTVHRTALPESNRDLT